jgi:predicted RNA-binding protein YlqC (UPF0109 family)
MQELVEYIVKNIVDEPDAVEVVEREGQRTVVLELRVASRDRGKVIGKQGRIAAALRAILKAAAMKDKKNVTLDILT